MESAKQLNGLPATALCVAVVEDDATARDIMQSLLRLDGCQVVTAADGQSGVDAILHHRPTLAFIDIGLPEMDGYDVARCIREQLTSDAVYLVALTSYGSEHDRLAALAAGFDEHLVKPLNVDDMYRVVRQLRDRSELVTHQRPK